jgi:hypothetical protein
MDLPEVRAFLVAAAVFKTVVPCDKRAAGGFDSHALPLIAAVAVRRNRWLTECSLHGKQGS